MSNKAVGGSSIPKCLPDSDIFGNISDIDLQALSDVGEWIVLTDEYLLLQGSPIEHIYYVYEGNVEIKKVTANGTKSNSVIRLKAGDSIGEVSFLSRSIAQSDIQAVGKVIFWKIAHEDLFNFLSEHEGGTQICMNLAGDLASRLHDANGKIMELTDMMKSYLEGKQHDNHGRSQDQEKIRKLEKLLHETRKARNIPQKRDKNPAVKKQQPTPAKKFVAPKKKNNQAIILLAFVLLLSVSINLNYFIKKSEFAESTEQMNNEIDDLKKKLEDSENEAHRVTLELNRTQNNKDIYQSEMDALRRGNVRLKNQLDEKSEEARLLSAEKIELQRQLDRAQTNNQELLDEIQELRSKRYETKSEPISTVPSNGFTLAKKETRESFETGEPIYVFTLTSARNGSENRFIVPQDIYEEYFIGQILYWDLIQNWESY